MNRLACVMLAIVLGACPAKQAATGPTGAGGEGAGSAGCPGAKDVYVASYVQQDPGKGRSGWVVPLGAKAVTDGSQVPEYAAMDAGAAASAGAAPAPQGTLWLITPTAPPCKLKLGGFYQARIDGPPVNASYGVEVEGCPAPRSPEEAGGFVLVSQNSPGACRFEQPQPIAARLGETNNQKQWQRPTKETPIPPALAALVPPHTCTAPDCETLWAFAEVKANNATVAWTGAVNWLQVGAPADQCTWKSERWSGVFVPGPNNTAVKVSEGQEQHSLALIATLVDTTGAKVLLAEGPGQYATYDVAAGSAPLGHHITYMIPPDSAWETVDDIGPICEQPH